MAFQEGDDSVCRACGRRIILRDGAWQHELERDWHPELPIMPVASGDRRKWQEMTIPFDRRKKGQE